MRGAEGLVLTARSVLGKGEVEGILTSKTLTLISRTSNLDSSNDLVFGQFYSVKHAMSCLLFEQNIRQPNNQKMLLSLGKHRLFQ